MKNTINNEDFKPKDTSRNTVTTKPATNTTYISTPKKQNKKGISFDLSRNDTASVSAHEFNQSIKEQRNRQRLEDLAANISDEIADPRTLKPNE